MRKNSVYITYYDAVTALGPSCDEALCSMQVKPPHFHRYEADHLFKHPVFAIDFLEQDDLCRSTAIACHLLENWPQPVPDLPLFFSTSTGNIDESEKRYPDLYEHKIDYALLTNHFFNKVPNDLLKKYPQLLSEYCTFSTACSSSGQAILQAYRFIQAGIIDKALILGIDVLTLTTCIGFDSLKLVSHQGAQPLTRDRDGLTLGEGGGILLLEANAEERAKAEICGAYSNSDGFHISSPDPAGNSQKECIQQAVKQARINLSEIDYINAHGTGTIMNDEIEVKVVGELFKDQICMTSLKSFTGHTLGASTAVELALCLAMIKDNRIIQPLNFGQSMDQKIIPEKTLSQKTAYFLKNSFGFGGNNISLVIRNLS